MVSRSSSAKKRTKLGICGLGYVGLPLAIAFSKHFETIGYDHNAAIVSDLSHGRDPTASLSEKDAASLSGLTFSSDPASLADCAYLIIAVPTPLTDRDEPDLELLCRATENVAKHMSNGVTVVIESTVSPGTTEGICKSILERVSGKTLEKDFFLGYAPERINPGDPDHQLADVIKVVAGTTAETADRLAILYSAIVPAGVHVASSICVAEAAKLIENTQRDVNIALMNEFAAIFGHLGIDMEEILRTAGTKWNFLPFRPGLVGGHCTPVDPHYLEHSALDAGFQPRIIPVARGINNAVPGFLAGLLLRHFERSGRSLSGTRLLQLGITYKPNCADLRNSRAVDLVRELQALGAEVDAYDPFISTNFTNLPDNVLLRDEPEQDGYDGIVVAVGHTCFQGMGADALRKFGRHNHVLADFCRIVPREQTDLVY